MKAVPITKPIKNHNCRWYFCRGSKLLN